MNTLLSILDIFHVEPTQKSPIELGIKRAGLASLFRQLGFTLGAEIGVESGVYSEVLLSSVPDLFLYMVDPWRPQKGYRDHVSQEKLDGFMAEALGRVKNYAHKIVRKTSTEAVKVVKNGSLDFVYIDGDHEFLHVAQDIAHWEKRVRVGGIIAGHDFRRVKGEYINHVKDVVQAWTYSHKISPWFVCRGDNCPSWFWVKE